MLMKLLMPCYKYCIAFFCNIVVSFNRNNNLLMQIDESITKKLSDFIYNYPDVAVVLLNKNGYAIDMDKTSLSQINQLIFTALFLNNDINLAQDIEAQINIPRGPCDSLTEHVHQNDVARHRTAHEEIQFQLDGRFAHAVEHQPQCGINGFVWPHFKHCDAPPTTSMQPPHCGHLDC